MEIARIEVGLPTAYVSNADVIELVTASSNNVDDICYAEIENFFRAAGSEWRMWRSNNNDPSNILSSTVENLFMHYSRDKIKIVIWCGVTKCFAEPAHASIFCDKNNIMPKMAFDISDGCLGWITALDVVRPLMDNIGDDYALIVSHEFPMGQNGAIHPRSFNVSSPSVEVQAASHDAGGGMHADTVKAFAPPSYLKADGNSRRGTAMLTSIQELP